MPTLNALAAQVRQQLLGYALTQETVSALSADMTASAATFTVDTADVRNIGRGVVEIDDELVLVRSYDSTTGAVTVMGGVNGRGYQGTTAASHSANALITSAPAFPRARVKEAINQAITGLYPDLVAFGTTEITRVSVVFEYEMPAEAMDVWYVTGETVGPTKVWQPLQNYRFNPKANTTDFASGKSIQLLDEIVPGQKYRVVYAKTPTALSSGSAELTTTGYPASVEDVVLYGACARLAPAYEAGRLQQRAVEAAERSTIVQPQSALRTAAYYQGLYEQALLREKRRQFAEVPTFASYQGS
ncbi:phage adaptor protein [Streptomyces sp. URMC 129]|uniref:phage adaptor protein n=1 Tax=Streptomyces sp. URMC 129 TaxID=3423407 RepID=UPI003F1CFD80